MAKKSNKSAILEILSMENCYITNKQFFDDIIYRIFELLLVAKNSINRINEVPVNYINIYSDKLLTPRIYGRPENVQFILDESYRFVLDVIFTSRENKTETKKVKTRIKFEQYNDKSKIVLEFKDTVLYDRVNTESIYNNIGNLHITNLRAISEFKGLKIKIPKQRKYKLYVIYKRIDYEYNTIIFYLTPITNRRTLVSYLKKLCDEYIDSSADYRVFKYFTENDGKLLYEIDINFDNYTDDDKLSIEVNYDNVNNRFEFVIGSGKNNVVIKNQYKDLDKGYILVSSAIINFGKYNPIFGYPYSFIKITTYSDEQLDNARDKILIPCPIYALIVNPTIKEEENQLPREFKDLFGNTSDRILVIKKLEKILKVKLNNTYMIIDYLKYKYPDIMNTILNNTFYAFIVKSTSYKKLNNHIAIAKTLDQYLLRIFEFIQNILETSRATKYKIQEFRQLYNVNFAGGLKEQIFIEKLSKLITRFNFNVVIDLAKDIKLIKFQPYFDLSLINLANLIRFIHS